jgi:diacylglycerol kinase (ATP)
MKPGERGLSRLISATRYSLWGLRAAWQHEAAFRQETTLAAIGILLALWLARDSVDFLLLSLPLLLLLLAELANSAIESITDRIGHEEHELSGRAKDMGSAMVFIAILIAGLSWCTILWEICISRG